MKFDIEFKKNKYPGIYIAIEGIDGCGKTTQVKKLKACLETQGKKVTVIREPRKTGSIGRFIREILISKITLHPVALQYLFAADRTVQLSETVLPLLKKGEVIISDRSFWSAIPYGLSDKTDVNYSGQEKTEHVAQGILAMYNGFIMPDAIIYLHVPVEMAMERLRKRKKEREIYERKAKLEKIKFGYDWLMKHFSKILTPIDGSKSIDEVTKEIMQKIVS